MGLLAPDCRLTAGPDLRRRCAGGPFQGSVPAFSKSTSPSFAQSGTRAGLLAPIYLAYSPNGSGRRRSRHSAPISREPPRIRGSFVDQHFSLTGTLRIYRRAIGWDLLRVPANLLLSPATLTVLVASRIAARLGLARTAAWLDGHRPFFVRRLRARSHGSSQRSCCSSLSHSPAARAPGTLLPT